MNPGATRDALALGRGRSPQEVLAGASSLAFTATNGCEDALLGCPPSSELFAGLPATPPPKWVSAPAPNAPRVHSKRLTPDMVSESLTCHGHSNALASPRLRRILALCNTLRRKQSGRAARTNRRHGRLLRERALLARAGQRLLGETRHVSPIRPLATVRTTRSASSGRSQPSDQAPRPPACTCEQAASPPCARLRWAQGVLWGEVGGGALTAGPKASRRHHPPTPLPPPHLCGAGPPLPFFGRHGRAALRVCASG